MTEGVDLLEIHFAGARQKPQETRALPAQMYGDPANIVRFESEKCRGCVYSRPGKTGEFCSKGKRHGTRCAEYKGRAKK
jgi:hypothetical protein